MIIDKELFPEEYKAVEGLLLRSKHFEAERKKRTVDKLRRIEECRRALNEEHSE